jgi:hypothetical protein
MTTTQIDPFDAISLGQAQIASAATALREEALLDAVTIEKLRQQLAASSTGIRPARMLVGADPTNGLSSWSAAGLLSVASKYGDGASVRAFGSAGNVAVRPPKSRLARIHWSWAMPKSAAGKLDVAAALKIVQDEAVVARGFASALDDDEAEGIHELDHKVNAGEITLDDGIRVKAAFWSTVDKLRDRGDLAQIKVVNTLTGWSGDPKNTLTKGDLSRYMTIPAEALGLDFDGISPGVSSYPDFFDEVGAAAEALARTPGYEYWKVPEFGSPRFAGDTTGAERAAFYSRAFDAFERAGCASTEVYDYKMRRDYTIASTSPEATAIRQRVALSKVAA